MLLIWTSLLTRKIEVFFCWNYHFFKSVDPEAEPSAFVLFRNLKLIVSRILWRKRWRVFPFLHREHVAEANFLIYNRSTQNLLWFLIVHNRAFFPLMGHPNKKTDLTKCKTVANMAKIALYIHLTLNLKQCWSLHSCHWSSLTYFVLVQLLDMSMYSAP
jgi:hypothetical protein